MSKSVTDPKTGIPNSPWFYFFSFFISNSLLAYFSISLQAKLWIGLLGLLIPLCLGFARLTSKDPLPALAENFDSLPEPGPVLWFFFFALLFFTQFYRFRTVPFWPVMDEGLEAYFAIRLDQHWNWNLLLGEAQMEPLFNWFLAFVFKLAPPSLVVLKIVSSFLFLASTGAAYWALRKFFNKTFSFYFLWIFAFSFSSYSFSKLCIRSGLFLALEFTAFGLLGSFLKSEEPFRRRGYGFALTLVVGLGFYLYTSWACVAAVLLLTVGYHCFFVDKKETPVFFGFCLVGFLILLPMLLTRMEPHGLSWVQNHFDGTGFGLPFLAAFFWYGFDSVPFGPNWGGFLNSLLGSLVLLGALRFLISRKALWAEWFLACFAVFYAPALLTTNVEMHRLLHLVPFFLVVGLIGLETLMSRVSPSLRIGGMALLFLASFSMDAYHYLVPYQRTEYLPEGKKYWRSVELYRAYELLKSKSSQDRPLALLDDFSTDYMNRTLDVAAFAFNALDHPDIPPQSLKTVAVLANANYQPFLEKRFPEGTWTWLAPDITYPSFNLVLGIIPISDKNRADLERWIAAEKIFKQVNGLYLMYKPGESRSIVARTLEMGYPLFRQDPFLVSIYFEKLALYDNIQRNQPAALACYQSALKEGYPAAHLYNEAGALGVVAHNLAYAKQSFERALKCPVNRTPAVENLKKISLVSARSGNK